MSVGLDTSVVVRLLLGAPADQCATAWTLLESEHNAGHPALVADIVVAEAFFVLQHHYSVPAGEALEALRALLQDKRIVGESAVAVLSGGSLGDSSTDFLDALIHKYYADARRTFATFDKKASRLRGSQLLK